jgi:hypothetical protein
MNDLTERLAVEQPIVMGGADPGAERPGAGRRRGRCGGLGVPGGWGGGWRCRPRRIA